MKKAIFYLFVGAIFVSTSSFSYTYSGKTNTAKKQDVAVYIKNTAFPIREDNKYFMAKKQPTTQPYKNAVKLQQYAKTLFNKGSYDQALICSSKARQVAVRILTGFTNDKVAAHYTHYPDEKKSFTVLQNDHSTASDWLKRIK